MFGHNTKGAEDLELNHLFCYRLLFLLLSFYFPKHNIKKLLVLYSACLTTILFLCVLDFIQKKLTMAVANTGLTYLCA